MSRKKKQAHANHERWLVSYADFITLLFAFFVVLFASSQTNKHKQDQLARAIQNAFAEMGIFEPHSKLPPLDDHASALSDSSGKPNPLDLMMQSSAKPEDFTTLKNQLSSLLSKEITGHTVEIYEDGDGLVISLREAGFFDSGSARVRSSTLPVLDRIVQTLAKSNHNLRIEGHTDNVPIHTAQFSSNWELSTERATAIARIFLQKTSMDPARLSAAGYAQYHPIASNATAEGRARNRRVDVIVLAHTFRLQPTVLSKAAAENASADAPTIRIKPIAVAISPSASR
ncbi:MAG: flagellar motor protein MotB [Acidobacteriaceae bacterium]